MPNSSGGAGQERRRDKFFRKVLPLRSGPSGDQRTWSAQTIGGGVAQISSSSTTSSVSAVALPPLQQANRPNGSANVARRDVDGTILLERSLQRLGEDEQKILQQYTSHATKDVGAVLQSVLDATRGKQRLCESEQWTFTFSGRTLVLRNEAEKIVKWLDRFKAAGDVVANADPIHVGLPWAGVRMLLEVTISDSRQMCALLTGLDIALYVTNRLNVYVKYLHKLPSCPEQANFESRLVVLHATILQFFARAIKIYQKGSGRRMLEAFLKISDVEDFENDYRKHADEVRTEAENCDRILAERDRESIRDWFRDLKEELKQLDSINRSLERIESTVSAVWTYLADNERAKILMWISTVPYEDNHESARQGHTPGTGDWIFQDSCYRSWNSGSSSIILWLHGNAGAGKTKLITHVTESLLKRPPDEALAYFYCNRNEDARRNPANVLLSFVRQLSISSDGKDLHSAVAEKYREKLRSGFSSAHLSDQEAESILQILVKAYKRTTLIVDALDECDKVSRLELVETFNRLIENIPNLKILISSRRDDDIKRKLEKKAKLEVDATKNQEDIEKFVLARLDEDEVDRRIPFSNQLRRDIVDTLFKKSDGMFQWASLQMAQVLALERERDVRARLGSLPKGLPATYDEIYAKIQSQEGSKPEVAIRALQWIFASPEPLNADIMLAAVCQSADNKEPQQVDVGVDFVLSSCQNLVVLDQAKFFRLSHLSVREYFEEYHPQLIRNGISLTAYVCLRLLINPANWEISALASERFPGSDVKSITERPSTTSLGPLIDYARFCWPNQCYAMEMIDDHAFTALQLEFLGSLDGSKQAYRKWHHMISTASIFSVPGESIVYYHKEALEPVSSVLLPICIFGLKKVLEEVSSKAVVPANLENDHGSSLLALAAMQGHRHIAEFLMDHSANVNTLQSDYGSARAAAAQRGSEPIVRLLLEHGAEVNTQLSGDYGSALAAAARGGSEPIVRLLLEHGAEVNAQLSGDYGSALAVAAEGGSEPIVRLLLEHGAEVNAQLSGYYGSALAAAAAWRGSESIVRLLLEHGADVDERAIAAAKESRDSRALQLLRVKTST